MVESNVVDMLDWLESRYGPGFHDDYMASFPPMPLDLPALAPLIDQLQSSRPVTQRKLGEIDL